MTFFHPSFRLHSLLLIIALAFIWLAPTSVSASEIRYAKPALSIPMRQDARNNAEVKSFVPMDTQVTVLRQDGDWTRIRLASGGEGWVRSRELGEKPILPLELLALKEGGRANLPPIQHVQHQFKKLEGENKALREETTACVTELNSLKNRYDTLIADPNSTYQIKKSLSAAELQIEELQKQLEAAQIESAVLKKNEAIKWFIAGSVVLLLGWLIGRLTANTRKKKASLL